MAEAIIRSGRLLPRARQDEIICDVADQGALWHNPEAHKFARLYFRPRNGFHFKTEGTKSKSDPHRRDPHMSIPIIFAFDFVTTITLPNSFFLPVNFAIGAQEVLDCDAEFDTLDFDKIYNDRPLPSSHYERQIIQASRMAEVVVKGGLTLDSLAAVACRTIHEERTLLYRLRDLGDRIPRIFTEKTGSAFLREAMFLDEVYSKDGILHIRFHNPTKSPQATYDVCVRSGDKVWRGPVRAGPRRFQTVRVDGPDEVWTVEIEGCLTYQAPVPNESRTLV